MNLTELLSSNEKNKFYPKYHHASVIPFCAFSSYRLVKQHGFSEKEIYAFKS